MKAKLKTFIFGLLIGVLISFPLGINFGRGAALFSNPFAERDVQQELGERMKEGTGKVAEKVKEGTEKMLEDAKEKIHEVTKPAE
ncbi:MAG: hypothetical protein ACE5NW_04950 [Acidiferrobacterales bacterium]